MTVRIIRGILAANAAALAIGAVAAPARTVDLASASVSGLLDAQASGRLSCAGIAQAALSRIHQLDPQLKAFITVNPRLAEEAAALDDRRRAGGSLPLQCIPVALKDNIEVAGMPTTGGSVLLRDYYPARDSTAASRLRAAGALIVGKTNLDELAVAGSTISSILGQTLNPYDRTRYAAGSSGGSAVAVSTGMAVCALGTETVNSLRNAASSAGVVAVRTSHGAVSRAGVMPQSSTMDVVGPLCKSVADTVRILDVIAGRDTRDPETTAYEGMAPSISSANARAAPLAGKTFGVMRTLFGKDPEHAPVNDVMASAIARIKQAGATIVEIDDAEFDSDVTTRKLNVSNYEFRPLFEAYLATLPASIHLATVREYYDAGRYPKVTMEKFLHNAVTWKAPLDMPAYKAALAYRAYMHDKIMGMMSDLRLDAMIYPSQKRPPVALDDKPRAERNGVFASALGFPAIDLPAGFTAPTPQAPQGLPVGLDMLGKPGMDQQLLELALGVEGALKGRQAPRIIQAHIGHAAE
ncbi:amidase [Achromobacter aloeverae]|uniref:amidase n=1 Tax=Achromobacter aloeverae TaxID=1750518 RepID=UPI0013019AF8|nr:amidase [Achromobacter aloeverae]